MTADNIRLSPSLRILIITLKDQRDCTKKNYVDKHGALLKKLLVQHNPAWCIENLISASAVTQLTPKLQTAISDEVDVIFTIGGTGVRSDDIVPEVVSALCHKIIPGIMENIRVKYGAQKPKALLSRSIAGIAGKTQIYTLPATSRALQEYCHEILQTLESVKRWLSQ